MTLTKSSVMVSAWKYWRGTLTWFLDWSGLQADLASLRPADYCLGIWFIVLELNIRVTENRVAPVYIFQKWIPLTSCGEKGSPLRCGWNPSVCLSNGCCWHPWRIELLSIFVMVACQKMLPCRKSYRCRRFLRFPNSGGILPVNRFSWR